MTTRYQHLSQRLVEKFHVDPAAIRPKATLSELDLDSLAIVELTMTLQDDWGLDLDEIETPPEMTLDELLSTAETAPAVDA
ncbi:phosphopantetheine-binding protein [Streptomyces sp. NPDC014894]|uniref:phosphopantetheine-binding protein n=1 Tax=unclassified Streptomyces TaxID=2593676 RepID=UPI0036FF3C9E